MVWTRMEFGPGGCLGHGVGNEICGGRRLGLALQTRATPRGLRGTRVEMASGTESR